MSNGVFQGWIELNVLMIIILVLVSKEETAIYNMYTIG